MESELTANSQNWSSKSIYQFKTLKQAQKSKDDTVKKAAAAFKKMKLIPFYPIYSDWLNKVDKYLSLLAMLPPTQKADGWLALLAK